MDERFDDWYEEKLHLIYGAMKQLKIQGQRDEFYQVGLVALWEASVRYEEGKGTFDAFAYSYILNRMKTTLSRMTTYGSRYQVTEPEYMELNAEESFGTKLIGYLAFETYLSYLSKNQQDVLTERFLYDSSLEETAKHLNISIHAVKNRTRDAIAKLRKILGQGEN